MRAWYRAGRVARRRADCPAPNACIASGWQTGLGVARRTLGWAYAIWAVTGIFGGHRFYLGHYATGAVYAGTGGLFLVGFFVDVLRMPELVEAYNRALEEPIPRAQLRAPRRQ